MLLRTTAWRAPVLIATVSLGLVLGVIKGPWQTVRSAQAQDQKPAPNDAPSGAQPPKEFNELVADLDDIDRLHALNPLKLAPEQMDKISSAITIAQADYQKRIASLGSPELLKIADEIRSTHLHALQGRPVPQDFDDKIIKLQKDIAKERSTVDAGNLRTLSGIIRDILKPEQIATATKLEKDTAAKNGNALEATDEQWFNAYVMDEFINNPRIVPLLKDMRTAPPVGPGALNTAKAPE